MPAKSPEQQRLFGMALAHKKGKFHGEVSDKIKELSELPEKTLKKYAETKHSEIKKKSVKESIMNFDDWLLETGQPISPTSIPGMGNVTPPSGDSIGSADRFDNVVIKPPEEDEEDDDEDEDKDNEQKDL